jgi:Family of unknown function (DUF6157)
MERVDYVDTFIAVAPDCPADHGTPPPSREDSPSIAARTYRMIAEHPYEFTSADVIFTVHADRNDIAAADRAAARAEFYQRSHACLRGSDLGKRYGWGIHADAAGRLALYGVDTPEYAAFTERQQSDIEVTAALRSRR